MGQLQKQLESAALLFIYHLGFYDAWFHNEVLLWVYLSDVVCIVICGLSVVSLLLECTRLVCDRDSVFAIRLVYRSDWWWMSCVGFTLKCSNMKKEINWCSPYPTKYLLLLKTCTSCYLSWDRLINAPVINRAFSLSCPWEDLSTYPQKINIPDQWNTHKPATSGFLLSVKINRNWSVLILTAVGWEGPGKIWVLTLALFQFVRLELTHSRPCKK